MSDDLEWLRVVSYRYRAEVVRQAARHGVRLTPDARPELARAYIRDLYKYELRRLRDRYVAGEFEKREYWGKVDALRRQYPILALRAHEWTE